MSKSTQKIMEYASVLCRICFQVGSFHIESHQIRIKDEVIEMVDILAEFSSIEVTRADNVPSMICANCADELGRSYITLNKVKKSDDKIREIYSILFKDMEFNTSSHDEAEFTRSDNEETAGDEERNSGTENSDENISSGDEVGCSVSEFQILDTDPGSETEENLKEDLLENFHEDYESILPDVVNKATPGQKRKQTDLAEAMSEIFSKADESTLAVEIDRTEDDGFIKDAKKIKLDTEGTRFVVSKFVLSEPKNVTDLTSDINQDELLCPNSVSQVRMLEIAAFEFTADEKINLDVDDDTNVENLDTMYMCKWCPRAFSTSHHLIMHARKSHVCQFCMQSFEKLSDFHKHTKEAHNSFTCSLCKKDFSSNSNLKQHTKRVHNIELPAHVSLLSVKVVKDEEPVLST